MRHRSGEAASAGAALLAGRALGMGLTLDQLDPVEAVITPDPATVEVYRRMRPQVDHVADGRPGRHRGRCRGPSRIRPLLSAVHVELAYGVDGRTVEVPDDATVILPAGRCPALADEAAAITRRAPAARWPGRRWPSWPREHAGWPSSSPT